MASRPSEVGWYMTSRARLICLAALLIFAESAFTRHPSASTSGGDRSSQNDRLALRTDERRQLPYIGPANCANKRSVAQLLRDIERETGLDVKLLDPTTDALMCTDEGSLPHCPARIRLRLVAHLSGHKIVWLSRQKARLRRYATDERAREVTHCAQPAHRPAGTRQ